MQQWEQEEGVSKKENTENISINIFLSGMYTSVLKEIIWNK